MSNKPLLSIISHGTDGSDGIVPGIHLRWFFYYKLGVSPRGFRLYRRKSDLNNKICLDFEKIKQDSLKLPFIHLVTIKYPLQPKLKIKSKITFLKIKEILFEKVTLTLAFFNSSTEVEISPTSSQIEVEMLILKNTKIEIIAMKNNEVLNKESVEGENAELKLITLLVPRTNCLKFKGEEILIRRICYWICKDEGVKPWEGPINDKCGFGIPFRNLSKYLLEEFKDKCDKDWAIITCRLGATDLCRFKGENFNNLKEFLIY